MSSGLALLNGREIVFILAVALVLFGAKKLPDLFKGAGLGIEEFLKSFREATSNDEKQSGLVYEALTHDNRTVEFVYPRKVDFGPISTVILFIAQGFGTGRLPYAPGTFGSLVGLFWFALLIWPGNFWIYLAGTIAGILSSIWIC